MKRKHRHDREHDEKREEKRHGSSSRENQERNENPPRTTSRGWMTTPKFGSATSGGGEIEPGPERD